jgi:hypothetical protein
VQSPYRCRQCFDFTGCYDDQIKDLKGQHGDLYVAQRFLGRSNDISDKDWQTEKAALFNEVFYLPYEMFPNICQILAIYCLHLKSRPIIQLFSTFVQ